MNMATPALGPSLGAGAGRHVDVNVGFLEQGRIDAESAARDL